MISRLSRALIYCQMNSSPLNPPTGHGRPVVSPTAWSPAVGLVPLASASPSTPVAQQWCVQYAGNALGVASKPCTGNPRGGPCTRLHPVLTSPLQEPQKVKLRALANIIQQADYKSKFLAAIV